MPLPPLTMKLNTTLVVLLCQCALAFWLLLFLRFCFFTFLDQDFCPVLRSFFNVQSFMVKSLPIPGHSKIDIQWWLVTTIVGYDRVSDVVESCVSFASKILTHHRMHWHWSTIAHLKANMPRIQNMYNMYRAKVDRLAGKTDFLLKRA